MEFRKPLLLLLLIAAILPLSGCIYSREIAHTRRDIERAFPEADFDHEFMVSVGPLSLNTVRWFTKLVPDEDARMAGDYLRDIRRVKVGVSHLSRDSSLRGADMTALRRFRKGGWKVAVKYRGDEEMSWVMYRDRGRSVLDMFVIVLSDEDLVLARVQGNLDRLLARVMEDHVELTDRVVSEF